MSGGDVVLFFPRHAGVAIRSTVLLLFASVAAYSSAVTVTPTVTSLGGLYEYAYSISYTGPDDAFLIDISVPSNPSAIFDLTTPAGFTSQFDSVNGLVSFLEDGSMFTATPTSGFSFDSYMAPGTAMFAASVVDTNGNIYTVGGTTIAPTPEPVYGYLLFLMAPALLILKRRTLSLKKSEISNAE